MRLRSFLSALFLTLAVTTLPLGALAHPTPPPSTSSVSGSLQEFDSEDAAQRHCPNDTVVWLNTNSGIYHEKGMRWYGKTKQGAYVCKKEADAAGDRDTRNGQ